MTTAAPDQPGASWGELLRDGRGPVIALILLGTWLNAADALVTTTIMPSVGRSLSGWEWFGWTVSGYLTASVVAGASAGWLSERVGLRGAMALAGLAIALGCAMSALAPTIHWFVLGRVLQGLAGGWVVGLTYVAMATSFPKAQLPRVFALATSVWGIATFVGPLVGGLFADGGWWRGVFWMFAGQALVFALATLMLIPRQASGETRRAVPVVTLALLTVAVAAISSAGVVDAAWLAAALLVAGLALLLLTLRRDLRSDHGLLPAGLKRAGSQLGSAYTVYFMTNAAGAAFSLFGPTLLRVTTGMSALGAGYTVASEAVAWTLLALAISGAGEAWRRRWLVIGPAMILAGVALQAIVMGSGSIPGAVVSGALLGGGFGGCYAFLGQRVIGMLGDEDTAAGSGAIAGVRAAGGAVGAAVVSLAANAAGFAGGFGAEGAPAIALAAFGASIPFALWALIAMIRLVRGDAPAQPATAAA